MELNKFNKYIKDYIKEKKEFKKEVENYYTTKHKYLYSSNTYNKYMITKKGGIQ